MAERHLFGLNVADLAYQTSTVDGTDNVLSAAEGLTVTFWSQESGGTQYTDLAADREGVTAVSSTTTATAGARAAGVILPVYGPPDVWAMWAQAGSGPRQLMVSLDVGTVAAPKVDDLTTTISGHIEASGNPHSTRLDDLLDVAAGTPANGQALIWRTASSAWVAEDLPATGGGGGSSAPTTLQLQVTANGTTDAAPAIQSVLNALASSTQSYQMIVEGATKGTIYLNSQVQIKSSNTKVTFAAPVLLGTAVDPDGYGGLSILGTAAATTTVSSGATRGSSKIVVASASNIQLKRLIRIYDNDAGTGSSAVGHKSEMAEVVDISGTTLYLDHPLHHTYSGTINVAPITPIINSGFDGLNATFTGQQPQGVLYPMKMQYASRCYFRNVHFRGDPSNSWSRECVNVKWSYRCIVESSSASFSWSYDVASTYDYGFTTDGGTGCIWRDCWVSNVRHAFTADKGAAGLLYTGCIADNATASAFDLHGGWARDILYLGCVATASDTRNSKDQTKTGYLAGNTSYRTGAHYITYVGCVARNYGTYTPTSGGTGESAGFGVVDGSSNISYQSCRVVDSQMGWRILSQTGVPITNISLIGCELNGIGDITGAGAVSLPIWVNAGTAPNDVDGLTIMGCLFTRCSGMAAARIYGTSGNQLANVRIINNMWDGPGIASIYPIDIRYVDNPLISGNTFYRTRRGVQLTASPNAKVVLNVFDTIADGADASRVILDSGGANTNLRFEGNILVGFTPTSWGTAITSSGASVTKPAAGVAIV